MITKHFSQSLYIVKSTKTATANEHLGMALSLAGPVTGSETSGHFWLQPSPVLEGLGCV